MYRLVFFNQFQEVLARAQRLIDWASPDGTETLTLSKNRRPANEINIRAEKNSEVTNSMFGDKWHYPVSKFARETLKGRELQK